MAELPAHPRIAHLLLRGQDLGLAQMACDVAALLGERDIQRGGGADLHSRLALVSGESRTARGSHGVQRARQLARQYRGLLRGKPGAPVADPDHPRWLGALLALAYPTASPSSAARAVRNTGWPTAGRRCLPKSMH